MTDYFVLMNPFKKIKDKKGFTLIELLVVAAIISLLSSIILVSVNNARAKARDTYRKTALKQLQTALELYFIDNGNYPNSSLVIRGAVTHGAHGTDANGYIPGLVPNYISRLPLDPLPSPFVYLGQTYFRDFLYISNGTEYKVISHYPEGGYPSVGQVFYDPVRPTWALMLCNGNTACTGTTTAGW